MGNGTYSERAIHEILKKVSARKLSPQAAFRKLRNLSYESMQFARLDHHRTVRKNLPEVVYAPGKTAEQLRKIIHSFSKSGQIVLITRLDEKVFRKLRTSFPKLNYSKLAKAAYLVRHFSKSCRGGLKPPYRGEGLRGRNKAGGGAALVTAGTSDLPVAEEAAVTLEALGRKVTRFYDLGVAGLHRLLDQIGEIEKSDVVICAAGMEGALPSVLAGLVSKPVIAVPTSVGYGSSFKGVAPLLTMLNSCSQGVAVVNIDSGFNAACFAHLILDRS